MSDTVSLKNKALKDLVKAFKGPLPIAKVGILQSKNPRKGPGPSNAEIGAAHEFGTQSLPIRSFLRMPLTTQLNQALESSGAYTREALAQVAEEKSILPWVEKLAVIAEGVVQEAFSTNGFGKWSPWKTPNYTNNTGQILVDTQQLRNSISSEVTES